MKRSDEIAPLAISLPSQLLPYFARCADAFAQHDAELVARPLGVEPADCQLASQLCRTLAHGQPLQLAEEQLRALYYAVEFVWRELAAEFHATLRELQKSFAAIITARTSKEMATQANRLVKQAEQAAAELHSMIASRGQLLDDCEMLAKKLRTHLRLTETGAAIKR